MVVNLRQLLVILTVLSFFYQIKPGYVFPVLVVHDTAYSYTLAL